MIGQLDDVWWCLCVHTEQEGRGLQTRHTASTVHPHNHLDLQPRAMTQFVQKAMYFKMYFL